MKSSEDVGGLLQALRSGLLAALGGKLYALYAYGAAAFPESDFIGDIDFHVILTGALTDREQAAIHEVHASLARDFPPLGAELDGYYILLSEAQQTAPPVHQLRPDISDASWALHREHLRAGCCIIVHGPEPSAVVPSATWEELERALCGELQYVEAHLDAYPAYCILNLCRLIYSFRTGHVVISKVRAAGWADDRFPEWRALIAMARRSYAGRADPEGEEWMRSQAGEYFEFACRHIGEARAETARGREDGRHRKRGGTNGQGGISRVPAGQEAGGGENRGGA